MPRAINAALAARRKAAAEFEMPFGKYKGKALYDIANLGDNYEGIKYLDWLQDWEGLRPETKQIVQDFLNTPWVSQLLDEAIPPEVD